METPESIDRQIRCLQEEIRQLRVRRNTLTRLCTLPVEILVHITRFLRDFDLKQGRWTRVMLVCAHMRSVVIGAQDLWADIHVTSLSRPEWTAVCLGRAGEMPLHLTLDGRRAGQTAGNQKMNVRAMLALVSDNLARCHTVAVTLDDEDCEAKLVTSLARPAPVLTQLELSMPSAPRLSVQFLGGGPGRVMLRSLVLHGFYHGLDDSPTFPALTRLELAIEHEHEPSFFDRLFVLLDRNPTIEHLTLNTCPDTARHSNLLSALPAKPCVVPALPRLRVLRITEYMEYAQFFLRHLPRPMHGLHLDFCARYAAPYWYPPYTSGYTEVLVYTSSYWTARTGEPTLPGGTITSERVYIPNARQSQVQNYLSFASPADSGTSLSFRCPSQINPDSDAFDPLFTQIFTLHLRGGRVGPASGKEDWSGALVLPELRRLVVENPGAAIHLRAIEEWLERRSATLPPMEVEIVFNDGRKVKPNMLEAVRHMQENVQNVKML